MRDWKRTRLLLDLYICVISSSYHHAGIACSTHCTKPVLFLVIPDRSNQYAAVSGKKHDFAKLQTLRHLHRQILIPLTPGVWFSRGIALAKHTHEDGSRNKVSHCPNGVTPREFLSAARVELGAYETVTFCDDEVLEITQREGGFVVTLRHTEVYRCRKVLLATGVVDRVPPIPGIEHFYGRSVHHCPYCDGWEKREQPLAAYGQGEKGCGLALMLMLWSCDIVLCTDGPADLSEAQRQQLAHHSIAVREEPIDCLEGTADGILERVVFVTGERLARRALFFNTGQT